MALFEEVKKQGNLLFKHRGILPLVIFSIGIIVFIDHRLEPGEPYLGGIYDYSCLAIGLFGLLIRIFTVGYSAKRTSGRNTQQQVAGEVNKTGLYSVVRHPLYVGNFFMWLGVALLTADHWFIIAFIFMYWIYYERIMFAEEEYLRAKFGQEYTAWAERTPAFIPNVRLWKKPVYSFNMKKVLRKEKNGILALLIIFFFFQYLGSTILYDTFMIREWFWPIAAAIGVFYYLLIKIITKKTQLLNNY